MPFSAFPYRDGVMHADQVPLPRIAAEVGTPVYVYSANAIRTRYQALQDALHASNLTAQVCFAVKTNSNVHVLRLFKELGAGADAVSGGELHRAITAGITPDKIVFSGVGKTVAEIDQAIASGIQLNIEAAEELEMIKARTLALNMPAIAVIRVNPNVDAKTHAKITTGKAENKFGVSFQQAIAMFNSKPANVNLRGLAKHIGSQLTYLEPFDAAFARMRELVLELRNFGHAITHLDLGGGLGVTYRQETPPDIREYTACIAKHCGDLDVHLALEPGRWLVGNAGVLLSRVILVKDGERKHFAILDAAMNDLHRVALYDAYHHISPVQAPHLEPVEGEEPSCFDTLSMRLYDVVGPVCETGDTFALARPLPPLAADDLVVLHTAGAYGATMASMYNSRALVPEVLVDGDQWRVIRKRWPIEEQLKLEV